MRHIIIIFNIGIAILGLTACTMTTHPEQKRALCKALANDIVFEPATGNVRDAEIASASVPRAQQDFDREGC